jgi:hypothetical protein
MRILSGPDEGNAYQLPSCGIHAVGRSHAHSDLVLHDLTLDRVHCELLMDEDSAVVQDNDSSTGTFVNGQKIERHTLTDGDVIRIGGSELCFERIQEVKAAPPPAPVVPTVVDPHAVPLVTPADPLMPLRALASTVLSHFALGEVVGQGHLGVTFRARDVMKNREVALKVLRPEFPQAEEERQCFVQTVKSLLLLRHANLVLLYGAGPAGAYYWLASEFLDGGSAAHWIWQAQQAEQPDWRPAFRLAVNIGWALQFLHDQRLVHGNVTPANILYDGREEVFKLADLIANKALVGSALWQHVLKDKAMAELPYLAPEVAAGRAALDARTDLYSLGAVVYAILVGRPPFVGETPAETIALIREAELVPPREFVPTIPEILDVSVRKLLARRPEERFRSAAELLGALTRITKDPAWQQT